MLIKVMEMQRITTGRSCYYFWGCFLVALIIAQSVDCMYPGLRRKPSQSGLQPQLEVPPDILAQLVEDHARRRLQQQFEEQLEKIHLQMNQMNHHRPPHKQFGGPNPLQYESFSPMADVDYTYSFPPIQRQSDGLEFAVNPTDPRYYATEDNAGSKMEDQQQQPNSYEDDYQDKTPQQQQDVTGKVDVGSYFKPAKNLLDVSPMKPVQNLASSVNRGGRDDINALVEKLQKEGKASAVLNSQLRGQDEHVVIRQHMGIEGEMGMYVVALIAGISAAVTVGLIALGIAWYTLQKKTKAAADVEYPAYGVTGPNKDISPSSDRRLAQSAQMYHYQHQKQQIIAMENRQAVEGHTGLSDVESDDDNEEGDYTVYECPGLAPTGEMEVKNPLFLDDTPVTPLGNVTNDGSAPQQQQTQSPQKQIMKKPPRTAGAGGQAPTQAPGTVASQKGAAKKGPK